MNGKANRRIDFLLDCLLRVEMDNYFKYMENRNSCTELVVSESIAMAYSSLSKIGNDPNRHNRYYTRAIVKYCIQARELVKIIMVCVPSDKHIYYTYIEKSCQLYNYVGSLMLAKLYIVLICHTI